MMMDTERPPEWLAKWMSEHPEEEALGSENISEDDYIDLTKDSVDYSLMRLIEARWEQALEDYFGIR